MITDQQRAIIEWAARHAVDVPQEEVAVSLGVRLSEVRRVADGIQRESESKTRHWRRATGALANKLRAIAKQAEIPLNFEDIAAIAGVSRQHLVQCRKEAERG